MRLKKNQFEENFSLVFTVGIGDVYISLNLKGFVGIIIPFTMVMLVLDGLEFSFSKLELFCLDGLTIPTFCLEGLAWSILSLRLILPGLASLS
jgi:hypothetical protein